MPAGMCCSESWCSAPPPTGRCELLAVADPGTELMLDLKGHDRRLPGRVLEAIETAGHAGRFTVCSQDWRLLEPFAAQPGIRVVHSVGSARMLERLHRRTVTGVSIDRRLLDAAVVADLRRRAELVLSWPVETAAQARELAGWGVQGLISQSFEQLTAELA